MKKTFVKAAAVATAVALAAVSAASISARAEDEEEVVETPSYAVNLCMQAGNWSTWDAADDGQMVAIVDGDGTYTASYTIQEGQAASTVELLLLSTDINLFDYAPEGAGPTEDSYGVPEGCTLDIVIDSIEIETFNGDTREIAYNGPSDGAFRADDDGATARVNILNVWTDPKVADIDTELPGGGIADGETLSVTFTVSGLGFEHVDTDEEEDDIEWIRGDVNHDGVVDQFDALAITKAYAAINANKDASLTDLEVTGLSEEAYNAADVNGSGVIEINEAYYVLVYTATWNSSADGTANWDDIIPASDDTDVATETTETDDAEADATEEPTEAEEA